MEKKSMPENWFFRESDLTLEVAILLLAGMAMLILGILLFPIYAESLPYNENGLFGLMLVVYALQTISMGKTPFGDIQRSRAVIIFGAVVASVGIITCFIPDIFGRFPRFLLILFLGGGGLSLLWQMVFLKDKYLLWKKIGGIFNHLVFGCGSVYLLQICIAVLMIKPDFVATQQMAFVVLLYGFSIIYLAVVLQKVYRSYPSAQKSPAVDGGMSMNSAMILLMSIFMLLLGLLLVPVGFGLLPFSGSAQLGLLMVLFSIGMLVLGDTPIGSFPRTRLIIGFGFVFAALGVVSCIIPYVLLELLTLMVGILNIAGGSVGLVKVIVQSLKSRKTSVPVPAILMKINTAVLIMNALTILFGAGMLVSGLLPGYIIGFIMAANGVVLFYLFFHMMSLEKVREI
jgi:hypothetical protein